MESHDTPRANSRVYQTRRVAIIPAPQGDLGNDAYEAVRERMKQRVREHLSILPVAVKSEGTTKYVVPEGTIFEEGALVDQHGTQWVLAFGPTYLDFATAIAREFGAPDFIYRHRLYEFGENGHDVNGVFSAASVTFGDRAKAESERIEFPDDSALSYGFVDPDREPEPMHFRPVSSREAYKPGLYKYDGKTWARADNPGTPFVLGDHEYVRVQNRTYRRGADGEWYDVLTGEKTHFGSQGSA